MSFIKSLVSVWNSFSPYKIGTLKKKFQFESFNGQKRYFLIVMIEGEECEFEVDEFQVLLFSKNSTIIVKCVHYQNSNYIQTILW
jgi:hypothetical protein